MSECACGHPYHLHMLRTMTEEGFCLMCDGCKEFRGADLAINLRLKVEEIDRIEGRLENGMRVPLHLLSYLVADWNNMYEVLRERGHGER